VRTGVAIALPEGFVGLVHPRSGLAAKLGVTLLNAPGTVDAGYRGEILINLVNHDPQLTAHISRGDRIAQLVVQRVERAAFHLVDALPDSVRGADGHGSTGGHDALLAGSLTGAPTGKAEQ
jgi:dUTP pyrophosphatase